MVGVIGFNIFECFFIGFFLEYIFCYVKVDLFIVCDFNKIM